MRCLYRKLTKLLVVLRVEGVGNVARYRGTALLLMLLDLGVEQLVQVQAVVAAGQLTGKTRLLRVFHVWKLRKCLQTECKQKRKDSQ